ncbi:hypothetical protein M406DRAFT_335046 [Cryphonectria parasitica EP155]|uniref:Uncharacterized protein n=1 Tax=Cryphonectria parasitica (strain ATCC 38755 / EP155) TaxID=660469 RepID=A0A9P4XT92_CRYP1|nr:uncharacterized protein M406DRAFT_335046 [Cryphonectria parasitica EP155]KAF3760377.1 hypothetical protein M406DRAFT_335046 [Cryphonectria parasitica EP155]
MAVVELVTGAIESARRQADRVVPPDDRRRIYHSLQSFASRRPLLFSFIVAQAFFALLPSLFFTSFVLGTLSVAFISALLFSLFWIGLAALVLASTLSLTFGLALLAWVWLVGAYTAASFVYALVAGRDASPKPADDLMLREKWAKIVKREPETNGDGPEGLVEEAVSPSAAEVKSENGGSS